MLHVLRCSNNKWQLYKGVCAQITLLFNSFPLFDGPPSFIHIFFVAFLAFSVFLAHFMNRKFKSKLNFFFFSIHVNIVKTLFDDLLLHLHAIHLSFRFCVLHILNNLNSRIRNEVSLRFPRILCSSVSQKR
jgi:hypothetical protein